ncbi:MAG: AMP-binding protein, partial [Desulfobulbaceae bacterium]|nr:AMP-binding protein [Desulfobulbaceae bacterium]
ILMKRVMEEMGCREILIGYGETEASPLTHLTRPEDDMEQRTRTVGRNLPHQEVKIIDMADGSTVPLGRSGELCFRGYHIMKGYYNDPDATGEAIDEDGWLHSGDLGVMDEEGYVSITGRLKEMIIRGGENIYPREIEEVIFNHPLVSDVAVFGVPDDYWGEEIMAWIILHQGQRVKVEEIRDFCGVSLAHFKLPRYIHFVDQFPMTVTGKVQKFRMRQTAIREMNLKT